MQALVWQAWGDGGRALTCLKQALEIPSQGDYIRLFVDEGQPMTQLLRQAASNSTKIYLNDVNRLLATFGSVEANSFGSVQPLIEPLSDRELEVLQNLATGMSNQAICASFYSLRYRRPTVCQSSSSQMARPQYLRQVGGKQSHASRGKS